MKKMYSLLFAVALSAACCLQAEVYLLGRGRRTGESVVGRFVGNNISPLHVEEVRSNGKRFFLEIYKSRNNLQEIYSKLNKDLNRKASYACNDRMLRYKSELENKMVEHLLFAANGTETLVFRILLPQNFSAGKIWHKDLPPLPGGAKGELVLELPERKSVFGLFNNAFGNAQGNLRAALSNLSDEWFISADESLSPNGRGAMLTGKKGGILLIGFSDDGTGFFYLKK